MSIFYVFLVLTAIGFISYIASLIALRRTYGLGKNLSKDIALEPISILKPLKGLDDNLLDNLSSFCMQEYPKYEIIFCIADYNDLAYKIALKVKEKFPHCDISIVIEQKEIGLNPKVNNLFAGAKKAKYDYILISDSNVLVDSQYLKTIFTDLKANNAKLVYNLIKGVGARSIGSVFENLHLNSFIAGSMCLLDKALKMPCVVGKSMLMHKKDLQDIGGFLAVKDILAEDYVIGKKMSDAGKKVYLSSYAVQNVNIHWSIKRFLNRHTRWGKLRRQLGGYKYISELVGNPVFLSVIPFALVGFTEATATLALTTMLLKTAGDFYLGRLLKTDTKPLLYFLVPVKDIIIGAIWFVPLFCSTTTWRGNRYNIGKDTLISPANGKLPLYQRAWYSLRPKTA